MNSYFVISLATILLQRSGSGDVDMGPFIIFSLMVLAVTAVTMAGIWQIFTKTGEAGWKSLVPLYNVMLWLQMIGRPGWYVLALVTPPTAVAVWAVLAFGTARSFGRGILFALGVTFLPFVFIPVLGFGQSVYVGPMGPSYRRNRRLA